MCDFIGAIDIENGKFVLPLNLEKEDKLKTYKCSICEERLILKIGEIKAKHFCHYPHSKCSLSSDNGESMEHKAGKAKLAYLLKNKAGIKISMKCANGNSTLKSFEIKYDRFDEVKVEYSRNGFIADVALINSKTKQIKYLFEVYYSHKTSDDTKNLRPEPWFEIKAEEIINYGNEYDLFENTFNNEQNRPNLLSFKYNPKILTCVRSIDSNKINNIDMSYRFCSTCILLNEPWVLKLPRLRNVLPFLRKFSEQETPCIYCNCNIYNPYFKEEYKSICSICIFSHTIGIKEMIINKNYINKKF